MTLEYQLTWGGIPFIQDTAQSFCLPTQTSQGVYSNPNFSPPEDQMSLMDLQEELDRLQEFVWTNDFSPADDTQGRNLDDIASRSPSLPKSTPHFKLYDFWYPNTASRWSIFRGLVTSSMARQMVALVGNNAENFSTVAGAPQTFVMQSVPISPNSYSNYTISTPMYLLSARPLREHGGGLDGLYLITLVDERYAWQRTRVPVSLHFNQHDPGRSLIDEVAAVLGITLSYSPIPAIYQYPEPDSQLWTNYESAGVLLDALAYNIGRVVVRNLDGTYTLQTHLEAQQQVLANRGNVNTVTRLAGGDLFYSGSSLPIGNLFNAKNAVVPAQINVAFPKYVQGNDPVPHFLNPRYTPQRQSVWIEDSYGDEHLITIPIASGGLAASGISGAGEVTVHDTAKALYDNEEDAVSGGTPLNTSGLTSLASQIAQGYYGWKLGAALDEVYPGTYAWTPEGFHDIIWTYSSKRRIAGTRVIRAPWNQTVPTRQHSHYPLSGYTNIPPGVGGPTVAQTWRDSTSGFISTDILASGNVSIASGDMDILFSDVSQFPARNNWRGRITSSGYADEICLFGPVGGATTGNSGGALVPVVYRGIDGSIQGPHPSGALISQILPNTVYGVNLVTTDGSLSVYQGEWTSGGICEAVLGVNPNGSTQPIYIQSGGTLSLVGDITLNEFASLGIGGAGGGGYMILGGGGNAGASLGFIAGGPGLGATVSAIAVAAAQAAAYAAATAFAFASAGAQAQAYASAYASAYAAAIAVASAGASATAVASAAAAAAAVAVAWASATAVAAAQAAAIAAAIAGALPADVWAAALAAASAIAVATAGAAAAASAWAAAFAAASASASAAAAAFAAAAAAPGAGGGILLVNYNPVWVWNAQGVFYWLEGGMAFGAYGQAYLALPYLSGTKAVPPNLSKPGELVCNDNRIYQGKTTNIGTWTEPYLPTKLDNTLSITNKDSVVVYDPLTDEQLTRTEFSITPSGSLIFGSTRPPASSELDKDQFGMWMDDSPKLGIYSKNSGGVTNVTGIPLTTPPSGSFMIGDGTSGFNLGNIIAGSGLAVTGITGSGYSGNLFLGLSVSVAGATGFSGTKSLVTAVSCESGVLSVTNETWYFQGGSFLSGG